MNTGWGAKQNKDRVIVHHLIVAILQLFPFGGEKERSEYRLVCEVSPGPDGQGNYR